MSRPPLRLLLVSLLLLLVLGGAGAAWHWLRPVPPEAPDTVAAAALDAALAPAAALPLTAADTDVLVIAVCTLRRDRLEPYGHDGPTSPFLDELGRTGVVFEHNFSQAPWTRPAMGALFTGRWPRVLGLDLRGKGDNFDMVIEASHTLLAERLKTAGYATLGSVANPNLKEVFGFRQGFDQYSEPAGTYRDKPHIPSSHEVVDDILEMVDGLGPDQRFYARAVVLDGHVRRRWDARYRKLFGNRLAQSGVERDVADYDAALRTIDAQLARLVTTLRARNPNLLVVLAADHGEGLKTPEHHGREHGNFVYRSTVETPLIVHHPALPDPGRRVAGLSMNVDVVPTILALLGLPAPDAVDGRSQAAAVLGRSTAPVHTAVFAETFFRKVHLSTVFDGDHQLIRRYVSDHPDANHLDRLYTAADADAHTAIQAQAPDETRALAAVLDAWEALQDQHEAASAGEETGTVDSATRKMLQDLGYIEEDE